MRRTAKHSSADILFDAHMVPTVAQEKFLGNSNNKDRLITMLKNFFDTENISVFQASEDADKLIVSTAVEMTSKFTTVFIVGEDVDLLVLLTASSKNIGNIFLLKPGKKNAAPKFYNRHGIQVEAAADNILFLHAFSGCDTTSAIYNQTKSKFISVFKNQPDLAKECASVFQNPESEREEISAAGSKFLLALYGCKTPEETSLNNFRYKCFVKTSFQTRQNLAALPPTEEAAQNHSFRTFQQVQAWKGVELDPTEWGWRPTNR